MEFDKPHCENCAKQAREHLKVTGQVPLTNALLTRYKQQIPHETESGEKMILRGMAPEQVVPFLREQFHWRVTDVSFAPNSRFNYTSLEISYTLPFCLTQQEC